MEFCTDRSIPLYYPFSVTPILDFPTPEKLCGHGTDKHQKLGRRNNELKKREGLSCLRSLSLLFIWLSEESTLSLMLPSVLLSKNMKPFF